MKRVKLQLKVVFSRPWWQSVLWCRTVVSNDYNPPKKRSFDVILRVFASKFQQANLISVHFICYLSKNDQSISRIFRSYFWRVFAIWFNCVPRCVKHRRMRIKPTFAKALCTLVKMCLKPPLFQKQIFFYFKIYIKLFQPLFNSQIQTNLGQIVSKVYYIFSEQQQLVLLVI